jgi:hypothetical protein
VIAGLGLSDILWIAGLIVFLVILVVITSMMNRPSHYADRESYYTHPGHREDCPICRSPRGES